jgi:hypothetical protein
MQKRPARALWPLPRFEALNAVSGATMRRVLEKMAQKLNEYDEASLMQLWQHFAGRVHEFEPSKRWEEAAIALCLIQAVHWKNQLFNHHLAATAGPVDKDDLPPLPDFFSRNKAKENKDGAAAKARATVLSFPRSAGREKDGDGEKDDA